MKKHARIKWSKDLILDTAIEFVKIYGEYPTNNELGAMGINRDAITRHCGGIDGLQKTIEKDVQEFLGQVKYAPNAKRPLTLKEKGIYIITCHQNNTAINKKFYESILQLKSHLNAKLIVVPTYYQTRLSYGGKYQGIKIKVDPKTGKAKKVRTFKKPTWSQELQEYYRSEPIRLNDNLEICAGLNIQATAVNPLSGLEAVTGKRSSIVAHPQVRWHYVATPPNEAAKVMMTTGSISKKNYTSTKAGAKGAFHHTNAALVVYVDGEFFWPFLINADNSGGFYHLEYYYSPTNKIISNKEYGLVTGDLHCEYMDPSVEKATWTAKDSLLKTLKIGTQVWHDVIDFNSEHSHHNRKDLIYRHALKKSGTASAGYSINTTLKAMKVLLENSCNSTVLIVPSNHQDHLYKFLNSGHLYINEMDHQDQEMYFKLMYDILKNSYLTMDNILHNADPFELIVKSSDSLKPYIEQIEFLSRNAGHSLYGIDVSQHGDVGPNGARGNAAAFSETMQKCTIGHSHTPGIIFGVHQVGHCGYHKRNYNPGYSSWAHIHDIIYPNGKRTLVTIINGKWRPFVRA